MASTAKVLSSFQAPPAPKTTPSLRSVAAPPERRSTWAGLQLLREAPGGALLLVAWLVLWTATWAAVAGPLSPAGEAAGARAQVASVEAP
jgi:hypothetical protein